MVNTQNDAASTSSAAEKRPSDGQTSATKRTGPILPGTGENSTPAEQAGSTSTIVPIPRPGEHHYQSIRVFKKVHRFLTYGISYQIIEKKVYLYC
ncbi:hypothetical protein TNCT_422611 [Trichonephila clavata]|uniref:Uncharacterized protein n=1 Tax=Trichonephila clavata TaxID=2740835 RepID=A0A8X6GT77_TRICU|nr:hypothetical protein TNCT_422611 [Trichonephila clavata]